jgi:hypothetical protein
VEHGASPAHPAGSRSRHRDRPSLALAAAPGLAVPFFGARRSLPRSPPPPLPPLRQGSLHIYPAQQNDAAAHLALAPLEWELQTVHAPSSQQRIAASLPLRRTVELADGDLVLICTGRFHAVEAFEGGDRLSGQCWLSYQRGSALRLWV